MLPLVFSHGAHSYRLLHDPLVPAPPAQTHERVPDVEAGRILVECFWRDVIGGPRIRELWAEVELTIVTPERPRDSEVVAWLRRTFEGLAPARLRLYRERPFTASAAMPEPEAEEERPAAVEAPWLDVTLVDQDGEPVAGALYEITFADGTSRRGRLGNDGRAHVARLPSRENCLVSFPDFDERAWSPA